MEANYYNRNNKNLIEKHDIHQKIYKVEKINKRISPIQDEYIEKYFAEKELNLTATQDGKAAYRDAE
ncbi:hypothetical protein I6E20_15190, partial [Bacteroides caecigallinarum]|nr:hypothetical protein [Bacteroides caecigallinarum]